MLDDLQKIHERDKGDVLGAVASQWQQLMVDCVPDLMPHGSVANIVYAAMGGSAMAAQLLSGMSTVTVPFEIVHDYKIPSYVSEDTLFMACSYSGNTEETIEAVEGAAQAGAKIVIITSGGKLADIAGERGYSFVMLPKQRQPRFSVFYCLVALINLLSKMGLCNLSEADLPVAATFLREQVESWLPTVGTKDNEAKQIAQECMGRAVIIYAGTSLAPAAYRWKMSLNEGAKQLAWWGVLPEFNHNEFIGWSGQPEQKAYAVIELRSDMDHPRIQQRFEVTGRLLSGMRPQSNIVVVKGKTHLEQLLWASLLGDFVSTYLALLNGYDPASLAIVDKFKHVLGDYAPGMSLTSN